MELLEGNGARMDAVDIDGQTPGQVLDEGEEVHRT